LIAAKKQAAERRTPLRAMLEAGPRAELGAARPSRVAAERRRISGHFPDAGGEHDWRAHPDQEARVFQRLGARVT